MPDWILNFTKGGAKVKKQLSGQARQLLDVALWGIPTTAQAKGKIGPGDRLLIYVGAPEKVFIGEATAASAWHEWTPSEASAYPMSSAFGAGIALADPMAWAKPVPLAGIWPQTHGAKTNPNALWYGAAVPITADDFLLIQATGRGSQPQPATSGPLASVPSGTGNSSSGLPESDAAFDAVSRLRHFLDDPKPLNEASTRAFFLDRIFDALGYSDFSDIDHGSVVQSGDYPDYVLRSAGHAVIAVEAKRLGHPLGAKEASQLVKYCSVLGLRWGVLTDGRYLRVYDAPVTGVPPEDRLVLDVDLNDWADREDFDLRRWPELGMLGKQAMKSGETLERFAARELIRELISDPSSSTLATLRKELETKKVLLSEGAIVSLIHELLG